MFDSYCFVSFSIDIVDEEESQQYGDFSAETFASHCISRRQLVGVSVETGPGFISISPTH